MDPSRPPRNWPGWAFGELDWRRWARFQPAAWRRFDRVQVFSRRDGVIRHFYTGEMSPAMADPGQDGRGAPDAGPGQQIVDSATVSTLEPRLRQPPAWAVWAPGDGAVDPVGVTGWLIAGAPGARVHLDTPVTALRRDPAGRIAGVETPGGAISGATVVLAAGVATRALCAPG